MATSVNFACSGSLLNPSTRTLASVQTLNPATSTETKFSHYSISTNSAHTHLANLEKLLQKNSPPPLSNQEVFHKTSSNGSLENKGRPLLEGLNISRIWEGPRTTEEMSPRHMNRLKRLLSKTPEYSPRNNLGKRWREYHGSNDWAGLLDPLDKNLRREVVRYGEFVQAAYHGFHSNPSTSEGEFSMPRNVALPDKSYRLTKSLYATSSVGLPEWVDNVAPDLRWMTQRTSWIGYVAVCDDRKEISRMGRRDILISLRGTATCLEWAENFRGLLVQVPGDDSDSEDSGSSSHGPSPPKVEQGFRGLYKTSGTDVPSLAESVVEEVRRLIEVYKGESLSITVTGHSLGAALALLAADELSTCAPSMPPIAVFSFGSPRVGNRGFANRIRNKGVRVLRVVNSQDVITKVPGMPVVGEGLENTPLSYSDIGTELRVDSKMSPYLKPNADVACCHDLEAYLHLVDGFLASNCPFRANAKRSLVRLLNEQGSNVKKLYISKAKDLRLNVEKQQAQFTIPTCSLPSPS